MCLSIHFSCQLPDAGEVAGGRGVGPLPDRSCSCVPPDTSTYQAEHECTCILMYICSNETLTLQASACRVLPSLLFTPTALLTQIENGSSACTEAAIPCCMQSGGRMSSDWV